MSTSRQKKAIISGVVGLALIILGGKLALDSYRAAHVALVLNGKPALLYITNDHPCECAKKLIAEADYQIKNWSAPDQMDLHLIQINLGKYRVLEAKYDVFRAPTLILLDARGKVYHRQDYPMIGGKPFDLHEFEARMAELSSPK